MIACIICGGLEFVIGGIILMLIWICNKFRKLLRHPPGRHPPRKEVVSTVCKCSVDVKPIRHDENTA